MIFAMPQIVPAYTEQNGLPHHPQCHRLSGISHKPCLLSDLQSVLPFQSNTVSCNICGFRPNSGSYTSSHGSVHEELRWLGNFHVIHLTDRLS